MPPAKQKRATPDRPPSTRPPSLPRTRHAGENRAKLMSARSASPAEEVLRREPSPPTRRLSAATSSRFRRSESEPRADPLNDALFERLKKLHNTATRKAFQRSQNLCHAERSVHQEGLVEAIKKNINFFDPYIVMKTASTISEDRSWDLARATSLLPRIKDCLLDPPYQASAVQELRNLCDAMLETLVKCAKHQSLLGVNVAAEERQKMAEECLKVLRNVRDERNRYYKKMSPELVEDLDAVIYRLNSI